MQKKPQIWKNLAFFLLIACLVAGGYYRNNKQRERAETARERFFQSRYEVMGTFAEVKFWESDRQRSEEAAKIVWQTFDEVNARFSTYNPESEVSRLNASAFAQPFTCSQELWDLITVAREAYEYSNGAFDISAGPLLKLWGIYRKELKKLPDEAALEEAMAKTGLDKVVFDDAARSVKFTVEGMYLDFGGIAKGWAIDLAAAKLKDMGITTGLINLGGNFYCFPDPPLDRIHYRIGIRHPRRTEQSAIGYVPITDRAIATSGDYERYVEIDGQSYSHIMDTRSGHPVQGMASVSVVCRNAVTADILSTAIFINKGKHLLDLRKKFPELNAYLITEKSDNTLDELLKGSPQMRRAIQRQDKHHELKSYSMGDRWYKISELKDW